MGMRDDHSKWIACTTIASRKDVAKGLRTILDDLYNAVGAHVVGIDDFTIKLELEWAYKSPLDCAL